MCNCHKAEGDKQLSGWIQEAETSNFAFPFVDVDSIPVTLFLQPVEVPLNSGTNTWCISQSSQLCISCRLAEGELLFHHPGLMKRINSLGPSIDPCGTPLVNGLQLDFVLLFTTLSAQKISQRSRSLPGSSKGRNCHLLLFSRAQDNAMESVFCISKQQCTKGS